MLNRRGFARTEALPDGREGGITSWTTCECNETDARGVPTSCKFAYTDSLSPHTLRDDPRIRVDITIITW